MATALHRLTQDDEIGVTIQRRLDLLTLEAMRDSLTPTGNAGRDVADWIASLTKNT